MAMNRTFAIACALGVLSMTVACGDDDGGGGDGGGASNGGGSSSGGSSSGGGSSACGENEIHVWGTLNGQSIDVRGIADGKIISLETTSVRGDPIGLTLESADGWMHGGTVACHGSVSGLDMGTVGNCLTDPFAGERTVDDDGDGATFTLVGLTEVNPDSEELTFERFCGGTPVEGELSGCFRY